MPYSGTLLDDVAERFIARTQAKTVLDIGAGAGKFGRICARALPAASLTAVEIEPNYVEKFHLWTLYGEVKVQPALQLLDDIEMEVDLVILGDVIEHHRKSEGLDLLHFLVYRSKYILIQYPERYRQNALDGYRSEAHMSVWSLKDFAPFEYAVVTQSPLVLVAVNGYLPGGQPVGEMLV